MKKSIVCFVIEKRMVTPITAAAALCFYTKISCFRLDVKINVELEANVEGMVARGEGTTRSEILWYSATKSCLTLFIDLVSCFFLHFFNDCSQVVFPR